MINSRTIVESLSSSDLRSATRDLVRSAAVPAAQAEFAPALALAATPPPPSRREGRPNIAPLSEETFRFQFTASRACHEKFRQAQDLLRQPGSDAIKRQVFERDGGRCTFSGEHGSRCPERGALESDHIEGFARTRVQRADRIRLLCRAHNQHAAETMYGSLFMKLARASVDRPALGKETSSG